MNLIQQKIEQFKNDLKHYRMDEEQQRLYQTFIRTKGHPVVFTITDKNGKTIKFKIRSDIEKEGTQHILLDHYNEEDGRVTAIEIISMLDVIKKGTPYNSGKSIIYKIEKNYGGVVYRICVKITGGTPVLKSFYSNRGR